MNWQVNRFNSLNLVRLRGGDGRPARRGSGSEQFWMYLNLDMVAPQTFARTFTKPGVRLY